MQMTPEEIYKAWRESKKPKEQIKILAEMNLCSAKDIEAAIDQYKKDNPNALPPIVREPVKKPRGKAAVLTGEEKEAIRKLFSKGTSIYGISKQVGRSETAVKYMLKSEGLLDKPIPEKKQRCEAVTAITKTQVDKLMDIAKALMEQLCSEWVGCEVLVDFSDGTYMVAVNTENEGVTINRRVR